MRRWTQALLVAGAAIWCLAIVAAPYFQLTPVYLFFSTICHQLPGRSWHLHGEPLAACIRCTSIYLGFLAGLLVFRTPNVHWFKVSAAITLMEWLLATAVFDSAILRVLSGVLLGATVAPIVRSGVEEMLMRSVRTAHESM